jgi:formylglycine-generating enzyme required for sulfatase activity
MIKQAVILLTVAAASCGSSSTGQPDASTGQPDASTGQPDASTGQPDASSTSPSCIPAGAGRTDCGPNKESCCASLAVPGGSYSRTFTNDGTGPTDEDDPATVSGFRLDKYLVTVGRFRQFVAAWNGGAGYTPLAGSGKHTYVNGGQGLVDDSGGSPVYEPGWNPSDDSNITLTDQNLVCDPSFATWTSAPGSQEDLPINCVNWYEAYAFCIWDGGFLPSEAEFEYAAAAGSEQREYPWGSTDPGTASQYAIFGCEHGGDGTSCTGLANLAPVGSATMGAGRWGQLDLSGEVSEWNLDLHATTFGNPCNDCASLAGGSGRVNRGGSYRSSASPYLQSFFRGDFLYATDRTSSFGIRCGRTP